MTGDPRQELERLGGEIARMQFSYMARNVTSRQYWQERAAEFQRYRRLLDEYHASAHELICAIDKQGAAEFMRYEGEFRQAAQHMADMIGQVARNPAVMDAGDRQQSRWSRKLREEITVQSGHCLECERGLSQMLERACRR